MRPCPGAFSARRDGAANSVVTFMATPTGAGSTYGGAVATGGASCWHAARMAHRGTAGARRQCDGDALGVGAA